MKVDPHIIEPFNAWWRQSNHCEPDRKAVAAFAAGFKAGMQLAVDETRTLLGDRPAVSESST